MAESYESDPVSTRDRINTKLTAEDYLLHMQQRAVVPFSSYVFYMIAALVALMAWRQGWSLDRGFFYVGFLILLGMVQHIVSNLRVMRRDHGEALRYQLYQHVNARSLNQGEVRTRASRYPQSGTRSLSRDQVNSGRYPAENGSGGYGIETGSGAYQAQSRSFSRTTTNEDSSGALRRRV